MALTSAEATVCLSINQANSIESIGGTCESVTIGHNPTKMALTKNDIFLEAHRPHFLCERLLLDEHFKAMNSSTVFLQGKPVPESKVETDLNTSAHYLLGIYTGWAHDAQRQLCEHKSGVHEPGTRSHLEKVVESMIQGTSESRRLKTIFKAIDVAGSGTLDVDEFAEAYRMYDSSLSDGDINALFERIDSDGSGCIGKGILS